MAMTKQDFIALADAIREHNRTAETLEQKFDILHIETLAAFCKRTNSNFMRDRWVDYINGECGPNGGAIRR